MIVYAEREERVSSSPMLQEIQTTADIVERSIRFGQFEAGISDALLPQADSITPLTQVLREAALSGEYGRLIELELPAEISVRPAEGFAYYALFPEMYVRAARRFLREERPVRCVVIGIRSIGTTLSTAVERVLDQAVSFTVRPRGHPFDRTLRMAPGFVLPDGDRYLIVDEGPGLSGSSFAAVAEMLNERGVPDSRIVFFPSHDPDPAGFISDRARQRWTRHRRYVEPFERDEYVPAAAEDLSGGQWRTLLSSDVPVVPQHERRKYLDRSEGLLWKWVGLGQYGRARLARAEELAAERFVPPPLGLSDGFLRSVWVDGSCGRTGLSCAPADAMARYLAFLSGRFITRTPVPYSHLIEMIRVNTGTECRDSDPLIEEQTTVAVDGRMLPQEWIETSNGWIKTDALDHHDDHFFPGCQDIAWDIAGASVEWGFDPELLVSRYLRMRPDRTLRQRLPFYRLGYSAYRAGYAAMAAGMVEGSPDSAAFRCLEDRYRVAAHTAALELHTALPASSPA